ncbi:MAG: leucine-rich repeat protein [Tannerella sp.]|nr:leucine-rich repeat protein [Tannerella sp.]
MRQRILLLCTAIFFSTQVWGEINIPAGVVANHNIKIDSEIEITAYANSVMMTAAESDFDVVNSVLVNYNGTGGNIVIPGNLGIIAIGYQAFLGNQTVTSVEIPQGVTRIETSAFSSCSKMTSVKLPDGLITIGDRAFYNCISLTSIDIPKSVKGIGQWTFFKCPVMRDVTAHWDKAADIPDAPAFLAVESANATLHVPAGMKSAYRYAYGWEDFGAYMEESREEIILNHWCWWLKPGETLQLSATSTSQNQTFTWKSDNQTVATVTGSGPNATVKAISRGNTVIRVFSQTGNEGPSCRIFVNDDNNTSTHGFISSLSYMYIGQKYKFVMQSGPENKTFEWISSNPSIASVDQEGLVTAIRKGTVNIGMGYNGFLVAFYSVSIIDKQTAFNSSDIETLKNFVRQDINYISLGLSSGWENDSQWFEKVEGVQWKYIENGAKMYIMYINWSGHNVTGRLDATGFTALQSLSVNNTKISEINVSGLQNLSYLECSNMGLLRYLDVSKNPSLKYLYCSGNIFSFNTLPIKETKYSNYRYAPQLTVNLPASPGKEIDMTDYLHNNKTFFKWYRQSNLTTQLTDIKESGVKGKFLIPAGYADADLVCMMTNSDFPDFTGDNALKVRVHVGSNTDGAIVAEQKSDTNPDTESVDIIYDIPDGVNGYEVTMRIKLPKGIRPDEASLQKTMAQGNYVFRLIEEATDGISSWWLLSIFYDNIPSARSMLRASATSAILNLPLLIDKQLPSGNYIVTFRNILLAFDNGTQRVEPEIPIVLRIDRTTATERIDQTAVQSYIYNNKLYINSPNAESIRIYSITGMLLQTAQKPSGVFQMPLNGLKNGILIITGSSGWARKAVKN